MKYEAIPVIKSVQCLMLSFVVDFYFFLVSLTIKHYELNVSVKTNKYFIDYIIFTIGNGRYIMYQWIGYRFINTQRSIDLQTSLYLVIIYISKNFRKSKWIFLIGFHQITSYHLFYPRRMWEWNLLRKITRS